MDLPTQNPEEPMKFGNRFARAGAKAQQDSSALIRFDESEIKIL
jgi:hypothetical protein